MMNRMWACLLLVYFAMSGSTLAAKVEKYVEELSDITSDRDMPCSHETLQQIVHGVIFTRSCNDDTLVDSVTNRLLEMLPELYNYSIIICPDVTTQTECSTSLYVAEVDMENYYTFPNDMLTRKSLAVLKLNFAITQMEPNYNNLKMPLRYRRHIGTTTPTTANTPVTTTTNISVATTSPPAIDNTITSLSVIASAATIMSPSYTIDSTIITPSSITNIFTITITSSTIDSSFIINNFTPFSSANIGTTTGILSSSSIITSSPTINGSIIAPSFTTNIGTIPIPPPSSTSITSIITPSPTTNNISVTTTFIPSSTIDSSIITPPFAIESSINIIMAPSSMIDITTAITTEQSPSPSDGPDNQGPSDKSSNLSGLEEWHIVIISAVGLSAIFCLIVGLLISCFYMEKRSRQKHVGPYDHPSIHIAFDEENFELHPITPQITRKISRLSFRQPTPALSNLLSIEELKQMIDSEHTDREYLKLPPNTVTMEHVPAGAENKNRYIDILPNPRTRVALYLQRGVATSDYINANYIRGFKMASKEYIATQGPLPHTVNDFWRMVWEQRCTTIVMLTHCTENGRVKCEQYWPDERVNRTTVYGELLVTVNSRQTEANYIKTIFLVQHQDKAVTREITHFWYTSWPDHGVPDSTSPVIAFVMDVRNHHKECDIPAPIVVHCSAGIGRSGVFIASDIGMKHLEENGMVDVLRIVSTLRHDRGGMVQTVVQYQFLYKLLYDYGIYMQHISPAHLTGLQPVNKEFPNDTTNSEHVTDDEDLETDSQISLIVRIGTL